MHIDKLLNMDRQTDRQQTKRQTIIEKNMYIVRLINVKTTRMTTSIKAKH